MRSSVILLFSCFTYCAGLCQKADSGKMTVSLPTTLPTIIVNGDTTPMVTLDQVMIISNRVFKTYEDAMKYYMLQRNIKIVYPYAIMAEATFEQCEEAIKNMPDESDKKHYVKTVEKQMMKQYSDELKSLTVTQGRLLIKLLDRQTGKTSYEIVKELRGSFSAFMWQTIACLFGNNLKSTYDADGEDKQIESIISLIEVGAI
jgi:hypothetical protein